MGYEINRDLNLIYFFLDEHGGVKEKQALRRVGLRCLYNVSPEGYDTC